MNQQLISGLHEAFLNGNIDEEINIAEKLGYYHHAGSRAKEHGLLKKAYENFSKIDENLKGQIEEIVFPKKFLRVQDMQKIEELFENKNSLKICQERYDNGNWDQPWSNKVHDDLIRPFKRYNTQKQFSSEKIKIYN